jgi:hypothetical protein
MYYICPTYLVQITAGIIVTKLLKNTCVSVYLRICVTSTVQVCDLLYYSDAIRTQEHPTADTVPIINEF